MKNLILLIIISFIVVSTSGQDSSSTKPLSISGYAEIYYQYDFNKPLDGNRPGFLYSHTRHNEFNMNLGFIKAAYTTERVRANLALATGTYMNANYVAETGVLKNIFEGNVGFKLSKKKNLWLDAGILPSHIGFESAVSKDCRTITRSLLAENSPYFEAGVKLTYITDDGKWTVAGMALNGWQRITRVSGNSMMSWGSQLQFKPSDKTLLNYSNFIGTDKPDSARLSRVFHNLYGIFTLSKKMELTIGVDIGTEENTPASNKKNTWFSPVGIFKYNIADKWAIAARAEYYQDKKGVLIYTGTPNGFQTTGYSINIDYSPFKNILLRAEGRSLTSTDSIFATLNQPSRHSSSVALSMAVSF
jgi:Putative beta-barrel porin-2, OmpL-like. bbp2